MKAGITIACSRPSVSGSVRRAAGERGKMRRVWEGRTPDPPRSRSLTLTRLLFRSLPPVESLEQARITKTAPYRKNIIANSKFLRARKYFMNNRKERCELKD